MRFVRFIAAPLVGLSLLIASAAQAQPVIPSNFTGVEAANGVFDPLSAFNSARTYLVQIAASRIGIAPGTQISGLQFRLDTGTAAQTGIINFASYEITLAQAARAINQVNTGANYAANMLNPALVRQGPLSLNTATFPTGAVAPTPNGFGPQINFSSGYVYQGGDLVVYITHSGHDNPNVGQTILINGANVPGFLPVDAIVSDTTNYVGLRSDFAGAGSFRGGATGGPTDYTGGPFQTANVAVFQLVIGSATGPEPGALAFVLLGGVAVLARKRRG